MTELQTQFTTLCTHAGMRRHLVVTAAKYVGRDNAEDLVQEALLSAWTHLQQYKQKNGATLSTWLHVILRNRCLMWIKMRNRRAPRDLAWALERGNTYTPDYVRVTPQEQVEEIVQRTPVRYKGRLLELTYERVDDTPRTSKQKLDKFRALAVVRRILGVDARGSTLTQ